MTGTTHSAAAIHQANIYIWRVSGLGLWLGLGWGSFAGSNYAMLTERGRGRVRGVAAE